MRGIEHCIDHCGIGLVIEWDKGLKFEIGAEIGPYLIYFGMRSPKYVE